MQRTAAVALTASACVWVAAVVAAPIASAHGAAAPLVALVYEAGAFLCHQRPERSFHLAGVALPVCARCFGLYLSAATAGVVAWASAVGTPISARHARAALAIAALPTAFTVTAEWFGVLHPSGLARALASAPLGAAAAWILVQLLRAEARFTTGMLRT